MLEANAALRSIVRRDDRVRTGEEVGADKGYHSKQTVLDMQSLGLRTYISEPDRGRQHWIDQHAERDAVYANRRRIAGERGQQCAGLICAGMAIFSNGCSCTWRPALWARGCAC